MALYKGSVRISPIVNTANTTTLSITPSTTTQSFTVSSPYTGYSTVTVDAITSAIEPNLVAGNIKAGVVLFGVTGTYTGGASETTRVITLASPDLGGSMDSDSSAVADSIFGGGAESCAWSESMYGVTATDYTFTTPSSGTTLTVQAISMDANEDAVQNSVLVIVNNTNVLSYPSYTGNVSGYTETPEDIPVGTVNLAGDTQVTIRFVEPTDFMIGIVYQMSWTEVV